MSVSSVLEGTLHNDGTRGIQVADRSEKDKTQKEKQVTSSRDKKKKKASSIASDTNKNGESTAKNVLIQGTILAAASIIAKVIGLIYRIPLYNILGDVGNSYYSTANEIYSIILMISSFSLPLAVSKLMSERIQKGEMRNANRVFLCSMRFAVLSGGILALITYLFAGVITKYVMNVEYAKFGLRVLAPVILIFAITGVFRGFFQGFSNMVPTAVSQVIEQIVNAVVSIWGAWVLMDYGRSLVAQGENELIAPGWGAAGATFGTVVSVTVALLFMMYLYLRFNRRFRHAMRKDQTVKKESSRFLYRILILTILPIILSTLIYNISNVLDQGIFNAILKSQNYTEKQYATIWGIYTGRFRVLMNVPLSLASSLGPAVVPTLTAAVALKDKAAAVRTVHSSTRYTMIITIPCAMGMAALGGPIIQMLFHPTSGMALSAGIMQAGAAVIILYSLSTLTTAILQGLGKLRDPLIHNGIALVIHVISLVVMLRYMNLNIYAVLYSNVIFALVVCILNALSIRRYIFYKQEIRKTFIIPFIASIIMAFGSYAIWYALNIVFGNTIATILAILFGMVIYLVSLVAFHGLTEPEMRKLPKGEMFIRIFKRLGLLRE